MNIAVVSPWPPQQTGIADYAYELVNDLVELGHEITVVTEENQPKLLNNVIFLNVENFIETYPKFDNIIYHMGNNSSFHIYQIYLLKKTGGTVHLHDLSLHHIMAWILYVNGSVELYARILSKWYGPHIGNKAIHLLNANKAIWDNEQEVVKYPFFEEVLQYADSLITHSDFAKNTVTNIFNIPALKIYQLYKPFDKEIAYNNKQEITLGIFGGVATNKRVDVVLNACRRLKDRGINLKINIVGKVEENCKYLIDYSNEIGLTNKVEFHGRVDENLFEELFVNTDICIALRYPSMGETSAIVMRAIINNIPTIVSNVAWYKELPECIKKIDIDENEELMLTEAIYDLCQDDRRQSSKKEIEVFSNKSLSKEKILNEYIDFLKEVHK